MPEQPTMTHAERLRAKADWLYKHGREKDRDFIDALRAGADALDRDRRVLDYLRTLDDTTNQTDPGLAALIAELEGEVRDA